MRKPPRRAPWQAKNPRHGEFSSHRPTEPAVQHLLGGRATSYQTVQRFTGAIEDPAAHLKALAKSGLSETGPLTRHCAVECGFVSACVRAASGR